MEEDVNRVATDIPTEINRLVQSLQNTNFETESYVAYAQEFMDLNNFILYEIVLIKENESST
ncbi:hypothetical protein D3C71_1982120 [compost metagenome]